MLSASPPNADFDFRMTRMMAPCKRHPSLVLALAIEHAILSELPGCPAATFSLFLGKFSLMCAHKFPAPFVGNFAASL
jgi:hypothetical protein